MALSEPTPDARTSQKWGPSLMTIQPTMWADRQRAYWQPFSGAIQYNNFHPAIDRAAAVGTPIYAPEAGICTTSYFDNITGGGNVVGISIRPGVEVRMNHCSRRLVTKGQTVRKGQLIARVGDTGYIRTWDRVAQVYRFQRSVTGAHNHWTLGILEAGRTMLYNPALFMAGGSMANDARIRPPDLPDLPDTSLTTEIKQDMAILDALIRQTIKRVHVRAGAKLYSGPGPKYGVHWTVPSGGADFEVTHGLNDSSLAQVINGSRQYWLLRRSSSNAKGTFFAHHADVTFR